MFERSIVEEENDADEGYYTMEEEEEERYCTVGEEGSPAEENYNTAEEEDEDSPAEGYSMAEDEAEIVVLRSNEANYSA